MLIIIDFPAAVEESGATMFAGGIMLLMFMWLIVLLIVWLIMGICPELLGEAFSFR